jgi:transposase
LICNLIISSITGSYKNSHVISVDEKTGIQALYRKASPMSKGKIRRQEYEYKRNGTTTLIGANEVSTGALIYAHLGPTRNEEDFLKFTQQTVALFPKEDKVILIADQLNIHKSESLVKWIASEIGYKDDLGIKGKKGILKSMESRMNFLEKEDHRIRFVFTPKHCSWLNPIENWFGKLQGQVITGGVFSSVEQLENDIRDYIQYYNCCMLKPLKWKFKGFSKNKILEDIIPQET